MLYDSDDEVKLYAVEVLHEMGYPDSIEDLINLLADKNREIRYSAAFAVVEIGGNKVQSKIIPLLKSKESYIRHSAISVLAEIGDTSSIQHLRPLVDDTDEQVRYQAVRSLIKFDDKETLVSIIPRLLESTIILDRQAAVMAFQLLKDKSLITSMLKALKSEKDIKTAYLIAFILFEVKDDVPVEELIELLSRNDSQTSLNAAWVLGLMGKKEAAQRLLQSINDDDKEIRLNSVISLRYIGDKATCEKLVNFILDPRYDDLQQLIILTLGETGCENAIPSLRLLLKEEIPSFLIETIIRALANLKDKESAPKIYKFVRHSSATVRYFACESMGNLKTKIDTLEPVVALLDDKEEVFIMAEREFYKEPIISTVRDGAIFAMEQLTGQSFKEESKEIIVQKWKRWWEKNKNNLRWSDKNNIFQIGTDLDNK
jgi:HEAT repeat protein